MGVIIWGLIPPHIQIKEEGLVGNKVVVIGYFAESVVGASGVSGGIVVYVVSKEGSITEIGVYKPMR